MIDIHSHILPNFDDGARTIEESVALASAAAAEGTRIFFATPHISNERDLETSRYISVAAASLQNDLNRLGVQVQIVPGAEVFPSEFVLRALDNNIPITLGIGGRYLLLDSPITSMPNGLEQLVFDLQTRGITPILAHPERSMPIQQNPKMIESLVQRGMLVQIDASSILGTHGKAARNTAISMLSHNWVHFMASDVHSQRRKSSLAEAARKLTGVIGDEKVTELTKTNGRRILDGEPVPSNPSSYQTKSNESWLNRIIHRSPETAN
jgi:protein-tyrosine phosphatase